MEATKALEQVRSSAEAIKNGEAQRFPEAASVGDFVRQGDLYITLLESVPRDSSEGKLELQLAPGTTKGSRHILDSGDGVTMYRAAGEDALTGPIVDLAEERTVTHPEHGDWVLPPGCYAITYQRAYAEELRRVAD